MVWAEYLDLYRQHPRSGLWYSGDFFAARALANPHICRGLRSQRYRFAIT